MLSRLRISFTSRAPDLPCRRYPAGRHYGNGEGVTRNLRKIRDADRAWLKYREAWVQFGASRWPQIPADQWRAWQTAEWTALLSGN